jgi:hypothetical protein
MIYPSIRRSPDVSFCPDERGGRFSAGTRSRTCGARAWFPALALAAACLFAASPQRVAAVAAGGHIFNAALTGSGLVVQGIPLPQGAEPLLTANLSLENLHALAPKAGELGRGRLRAVVYDVPSLAPPDQVAAFYRRATPIPVALALPGRAQADQKLLRDKRARVLPFLRLPGYMAIRSEEQSGPSRVTVALVEGNAPPAVVLSAVDALRAGSDDPPLSQAPALLSPKRWDAQNSYEATQLQILLRNSLPKAAPGPVVDVMRSLLNQARSVDSKVYWVSRPVPAAEVLAACLQEARFRNWRLLSVEADSPQRVVALYRYRDDRGMIMLRAERGPMKNIAPVGAPVGIQAPTTKISRLEVNGQISLPALFRPVPMRPPALTVPDLGTPLRPRLSP